MMMVSLTHALEAGVATCENCSSNHTSKQFVTLSQTGTFIDNIGEKLGWKNACESFVKDEFIGKHGEFIRRKMRETGSYPNLKRGDADLNRLCPNYSDMTENNKANVALVLLTAMAFEESSCKNDNTGKGVNGAAGGFFQLHAGAEGDYSSGCKDYDSKTPEGSISCTLAMINKTMSKGNLFRQKGMYWDVLRPMRWVAKTKSYVPNPSYAKIRKAITSFPACHDRNKMIEGRSIADIDLEIYQVIDVNNRRQSSDPYKM